MAAMKRTAQDRPRTRLAATGDPAADARERANIAKAMHMTESALLTISDGPQRNKLTELYLEALRTLETMSVAKSKALER